MNSPTNPMIRTQDEHHHVLLVDDDRPSLNQACAVLSARGIRVTAAESGSSALEMLDQQDFDAILIDVRMPGMNGYEVCRRIRQLKQGEFLPIIMLTGSNDRKAVEAAFEAGATDFESKPANWLKLHQRVTYLMNMRSLTHELDHTRSHRNALIDTIPDNLLLLDSAGQVIQIKSAFSGFHIGLLGIEVGDYIHHGLDTPSMPALRKAFQSVTRGASVEPVEIELSRDAKAYYLEVRMVYAGPDRVVALIRDFSERKRAEDEIRRLAYFDPDTGLPNASLLQEQMMQKLENEHACERPVVVVNLALVGLDYAQNVLGPARSQQLLAEASTRVCQVLDKDRSVLNLEWSLIGSNNQSGFLVCSDIPHTKVLPDLVRDLNHGIEQPFFLDDYEITLSARTGVSVYPQDDSSPEKLIEKSFIAMQHTGDDAQSRVAYYSTDSHSQIMHRARLSAKLRSAMQNGDLNLAYQPKVDTSSGRLIGVEALLRWHDDDYGQVSPAEFIPLAEANGLILPLGQYVLEKACEQSRGWLDDGLDILPIAVNFSAHQLNHRDLLSKLKKTLARFRLDHQHIEIELTESVAFNQSGSVSSMLNELDALGFRLSIDDFGTGYSSLSRLTHLPFHTLKIDRSFLAEFDRTNGADCIIEGIIHMAHALDMKVVAEGVEQEHQLAFLRERNCDVVQGYLTGRPMPSSDLEKLIRRNAPPG